MPKKRVDPSKTNARTLWTDAKDLLIGAEVLVAASKYVKKAAMEAGEPPSRDPLLQPTLLLVCSSMEAGFKSYLHHHGVSLERLRSREFGHNLADLHSAMLDHTDAVLSDLLVEVEPGIDLLNEPYMEKYFSYRQAGPATYPKPELVCRWIRKYLIAINPLILLGTDQSAVGGSNND